MYAVIEKNRINISASPFMQCSAGETEPEAGGLSEIMTFSWIIWRRMDTGNGMIKCKDRFCSKTTYSLPYIPILTMIG
jgi:hypothetical protein